MENLSPGRRLHRRGRRGYDWEISIDETPFDLWSLQGELPPPFESVGEKRWVKENKARF
jgi:hypothetical protein